MQASKNSGHNQGCQKLSSDGQAQFEKLSRIYAAKFWTFLFLAVRRCCHCSSASNCESKAWKFSHTECRSYMCTLTYVPCMPDFTTEIQSGNETTQKSNTKLCLTSAENGPPMAGPAGLVLAPMLTSSLLHIQSPANPTAWEKHWQNTLIRSLQEICSVQGSNAEQATCKGHKQHANCRF